jgi:hypothetical protein
MQLTDELLRELTDKASASPTSVMRRLLGLPVKGRTGERIDAVLSELPKPRYSTVKSRASR